MLFICQLKKSPTILQDAFDLRLLESQIESAYPAIFFAVCPSFEGKENQFLSF